MPGPIDFLQGNPLLTSPQQSLKSIQSLFSLARQHRDVYFPSPIDWRDEILYFLLPDRFSDDKENSRHLLDRATIQNFRTNGGQPGLDMQDWVNSASRWQGGTINGIKGQLDYLQALGITCIWIAPLFKQRVRNNTFHGYGIQDFLEIDARFGTRKDLMELIAAAHKREIKIILDVIINHSGNNWGYVAPGASLDTAFDEPFYKDFPDYYGNPDDTQMKDWKTAWRDEKEKGFTTNAQALTTVDEGVWPLELQDFFSYTRAGKGSYNGNDLSNDHAEHKRTDFDSLKDFALDNGNTLGFLCDCFKYWIALTDCDGFRLDTVKHVSLENARNFCGAILEFSESIGKRNFLLVGEIAGGDDNQDFVMDYMELVQRNLRAALDIGNDRLVLTAAGKGLENVKDYFDGFTEASQGFGSHRSFGNRHVSILDDHDHVTGDKIRFSAEIPDAALVKNYQVVVPTAIQLFCLGIPCIYYGTEQAFSGPPVQVQKTLPEFKKSDRYLRETMFGASHPRGLHTQPIGIQLSTFDQSLPGFGAFGTSGFHVFDKGSPSYVRIAALCKLRSEQLVLRVGRQYYRQTRVFSGFSFPAPGEMVAWSRILDQTEAVCIVNANGADNASRGGDVVVSAEFWQPGTLFTVIGNSAESAALAAGIHYTGTHPIGSQVRVAGKQNGEPAYLPIRGIEPAEVLVLMR